MMKGKRFDRGMVLLLVITLSLVLLTSIGFWYRKVLVQSFLAERWIIQRSLYNECNSLLPLLKNQLNSVSEAKLARPDNDFLTVKIQGQIRWKIGRSALVKDKVIFTFDPKGSAWEPIRLAIGYSGSVN